MESEETGKDVNILTCKTGREGIYFYTVLSLFIKKDSPTTGAVILEDATVDPRNGWQKIKD